MNQYVVTFLMGDSGFSFRCNVFARDSHDAQAKGEIKMQNAHYLKEAYRRELIFDSAKIVRDEKGDIVIDSERQKVNA